MFKTVNWTILNVVANHHLMFDSKSMLLTVV